MDKVEIRAVIKYFVFRGLTPTEIQKELVSTLGDSSPSFSTVKKWAAQFKRGRTSLQDNERSGRPKTATTDEIIKKIHNGVLNDQRLKVRELADIVNISVDRAHYILHDVLGVKKLSTRWVPRLLTNDQKRIRMNISQECLDLFRRDSTEFLQRYITIDELWIHYSMPETKQQSEESSDNEPKKAKKDQPAGKLMTIIFWDSCGVLLIDYLKQSITERYYISLLDQLKETIKTKRPYLTKKKVLFYHNNTSKDVAAKLEDLHFEVLPHAPHSPDLAPSDYYLFPNFKKWLIGRKFYSDNEVKSEINSYYTELDNTYYTKGIRMLEDRWSKCVELKGDYVEI